MAAQQCADNGRWRLHCNSGYANTPRRYVIRTFPVLLSLGSLEGAVLVKFRVLHLWGSAYWDTCNAVTSGTRRHMIAAWTPRYICVSTYVGGNTGYILWIQAFFFSSQNGEKRLLASSCLSVHMEHLGSHWTDFHEIWYLRIFRTSVEKIQVPLKSDKNNGYLTWISMYIFDHISLSSS
jgi:hypothetical protein